MIDSNTPKRPPVEPLSDIAWARVERGMWARLDDEPARAATSPAPRRWVWLAAPVAVAAALALFVIATRGAAPTEVAGDDISRVVAGAAPSTISFEAAHIALDAETAIVLDHDRAKPTTLIERGAAWFDVAPRAGRPPFVVVAGDAIVRVIGTRFKVTRAGERIAVVVEHGLVRIAFRGTEVEVAPDRAWSSDQPSAVTAVIATDGDRERFTQLGALEARDPGAAIAGYVELATRPSPWAAVALFAAGRLATDRHDRRAASLLAEYLRRFPTGANATDARQLLHPLKGSPP